MIFLDTNAFYYAADISYNEFVDTNKLKKFISSNDIAISSVSFFEFLTKYRNSIETIHKGALFLYDNSIKLAYNKYFPYDKILDCDYCNINEEDLKQVLTKIIDTKVDTESRFASVTFALLLFSAFFFYYLPEGENTTKIKKYIFQTCYYLWTKDNLSVFKSIFEEGYSGDDCEKAVKIAIRNLLEFSLSISFSIFDSTKEMKYKWQFKRFIKKTDFISLSQDKLKKIKRYDTSIVYISKLAKAYNKNKTNGELIAYLSKLSKSIIKTLPEKGLQEYLIDIVNKSCKNGSAFLKNDILDAIILCNIENQHQIISFDKGVKEHMLKYSKDRPTYKTSLDLIKNFEKSM